MDFLIALAFTGLISSPFLIWQFALRPYCRKMGQAYTTGANWGITMWVDWQYAKEIAKSKNHRNILVACNFFIITTLSLPVFFLLFIIIISAFI